MYRDLGGGSTLLSGWGSDGDGRGGGRGVSPLVTRLKTQMRGVRNIHQNIHQNIVNHVSSGVLCRERLRVENPGRSSSRTLFPYSRPLRSFVVDPSPFTLFLSFLRVLST